MDEERKKAFAAKLEEERKKKQQKSDKESLWSKAAKSGWLGTRAKITAEAEENK